MHIVVVGLNHQSAPIDLRERLAFRREQLPESLTQLRRDCGLHEAAVLSTCNRVEIYARVPEPQDAFDRLQRFLSERGRIDPRALGAPEPRYETTTCGAHILGRFAQAFSYRKGA